MNRLSKIQICLEVLKILTQRGLLKITHIMYDSNTNCSLLKNNLTYMVQQGLIEKKHVEKKRIAYRITEKGTLILSKFREFKQLLPIEEVPNQISNII